MLPFDFLVDSDHLVDCLVDSLVNCDSHNLDTIWLHCDAVACPSA
jgi:hypothetical protein